MAATTSTALGPGSPDSHLFDIICGRAGIASSDLSDEAKRALLRDEQTQDLWEQLRARIHRHSNKPSTAANSASRKQLAEFERVAAVQGLHDQASLTPDRIAQTEAELENLNRKTQSLVDTLRSHNTRLNAIADAAGSVGGSASSDGAKSAVGSKVAELRARKQALDEECEQMAAHADQRLDRYLGTSHREKHRSNGTEAASGRSPPGASDVLQETFDGLLGPHDRILEKLDALCTELQFDDSGQKAMLQDARRLSNETIFAIVAHQRMVLDIVFIQACESYQDDPRGSAAEAARARATEDDRETIVADLRSLWDEVVPVAHMAVEKQLVGPIMKSRGHESDMRDERYTLIASYTSAMLRYMNERLEAFAIRIRTLVAHHRALVKTFQAFKNQTSSTNITNNSTTADTTVAKTSANKERAQAVDKRKPSSRAAAARSIATPSTPLDDLLSAIEALGVSLPSPPTPPPAPRQLQGGGAAAAAIGDADQRHQASDLARHLDRHIQRRAAKSHVLAMEMQALFEATAKAHITDPLEAARVLADSLVAECSDGLLALPDSTDIKSAAGQRDGVSGGDGDGGGGGGDLFFADAELEKIIGDEARSVARIADEFKRLLRDANPSGDGGGGGEGLEPHVFVADAYRRATGETAGTSAAVQGGGMSSRGQQRSQQQMLRDPKIHEMVERWGGRGSDIGVGG